MNYYERHIGDYLKDTSHLSLLEHGVYGRLLDVYYTRESQLDDAEIARLVGARSKDEKLALRAVLGEFFYADATSGLWKHKRCDQEIARYQDKQRKAKASADARWSQTDRNANASPNAMRTHSEGNATRASAPTRAGARPQSPDTSHQAPEREKARKARATGLPKDFQVSERVRLWAAEKGHGHLEAQLEALTSYAKRKGATYVDWDEALMTAVREDWAKVAKTNGVDMFAGAR